MLAGVAGLVAGAMSMAAGEYVSVSSQSDTERADLAREKRDSWTTLSSRRRNWPRYTSSAVSKWDLARKVAVQLMAKDSLGAHARDELGISEITTAIPVQAALTSAATFSVGAAAPLALVLLSPSDLLIPTASLTSKGLAEDPKGRGLVRGDGGGFLAGSLVAVLAVFGIFFLTLVF